jgi:ribosomal protein S18 acetylase RimI-like enzyme
MTDINYKTAAYILVDALKHDPFYRSILADIPQESAAWRERLAQYFLYSLHEGEQIGSVMAPSPDPYGAAIWLFPQNSEVQQSYDRLKNQFLAELLGEQGFRNYAVIIDFMHPRAQQAIPAGAWYLSILGVAPVRQGQNLGERLLRPTLEQADHGGISCYLETFNEKSIRFYNRMGFHEAASYIEPVTRSRCWILVRATRSMTDSTESD